MTDAAYTPAAGVGFLRRRTLFRSARAYVRWVGKAVGWWTVGYLVFWFVVFVASGVQLVLVPAADPLPRELAAAFSSAVALWLALPLRVRVPPVHLDRRDLTRLALAPVPPRETIGYKLWLRRVAAGLGGAALGGAWSLLAASYLHLQAPWAAVTLAALAMTRVDLLWLRYAGPTHDVRPGLGAGTMGSILVLFAALSAAVPLAATVLAGGPNWGAAVTGGLVSPSPWAVVAPVALLALAWWSGGRTRAESWPPRFAPQSFVLSQLSGLRSLQLISQVAGLDLGGGAEGAERERLLAALHDRPGSLRPARSLPRPRAAGTAWPALAWRGASAAYRRPMVQWLRLALQALAAATAGLAASGAAAARLPGPGLGGALGGAVAVLFTGFLLAQAVAALLGPAPPSRLAPLAPSARTWGRLATPLAVLAVATAGAGLLLGALPALGLAGGGASAVTGFVSLALTAGLVLEKYSSWTGASPTRFEPQAVAAIVVALPALLLEALGYPSWTVVGQWALLVVVSLIDV